MVETITNTGVAVDTGTLISSLQGFKGDIFTHKAYRLMYATDASVYRELPLAVTRPRDVEDLRLLIAAAIKHKVSLIPRAAGTSLAGQVVGGGIIVDVSRYMTRILEINTAEKWVKVEPGVILDELNKLLEPAGLFFGPETSTSNRCMIGGMVGNNSCGAHSLVYGSTRDHTLEVEMMLSDGSIATFGALSDHELEEKYGLENTEGRIYRKLRDILSNPHNQKVIRDEYPDPAIHRRNTGYALDLLLMQHPFTPGGPLFNLSQLIAGSEGTLGFIVSVKLNLVPLPPKETALVCVHFDTLEGVFQGNLVALTHKPVAIELMDKAVLDLTKENIEQRKNRFFVEGDPAAILIVEFAADSQEEIMLSAQAMETEMRAKGLGYHFPVLRGADIKKVWALRKAGLGLLSNAPGDAKPVAVIEDTAVSPAQLPAYMAEFKDLLDKYGLSCVYYAHIATGELHLRPVLDLKKKEDVEMFHTIALETARLVKKYKGSLSGEHGDGRLRGQFIPLMLGDHVYGLLKEVKHSWDPDQIFNPGKITDTPAMNTSLRYEPGQPTRDIQTIFDFSSTGGLLRAVEKCNGSGDCRKPATLGGTMCPSYMAAGDEHTTTRARANILREYLTHSPKTNPFDHQELYDVLDLCLSCKGCKAECPSNVDITKFKAEFLQHWYDKHGVPLRTLAIAYITRLNKLGSIWPKAYNFFTQQAIVAGWMKRLLGFALERSLPALSDLPFTRWLSAHNKAVHESDFPHGKVWIFADEFTEYNDTAVGIKAVLLLNRLGYYVAIPDHVESGRTFLSKGLLRSARHLAKENVLRLGPVITEDQPLIGIEPSAILCFRDEYTELLPSGLKEKARTLAPHCLMMDEFIMREHKAGRITAGNFTKETRKVMLHGHCHQKALASTGPTKEMLSIPEGFKVKEIPSGCCGMAGSFGYEREHYELSMMVGELVLFPAVRQADKEILIAAPGTSCRHQIKDGTGKEALHPIEILYHALA